MNRLIPLLASVCWFVAGERFASCEAEENPTYGLTGDSQKPVIAPQQPNQQFWDSSYKIVSSWKLPLSEYPRPLNQNYELIWNSLVPVGFSYLRENDWMNIYLSENPKTESQSEELYDISLSKSLSEKTVYDVRESLGFVTQGNFSVSSSVLLSPRRR